MRKEAIYPTLLLFVFFEFLTVPSQCFVPGTLNHHYTLTDICRVNDPHLNSANFLKRLWYGLSESRESHVGHSLEPLHSEIY